MTDEEVQALCEFMNDQLTIELTPEQEEIVEAAVGRNGIVRMRGKSGEVALAIVRKSISNIRNQQQ